MTFSEWLNQQDIELCKWEYVEPADCTPHDHVLVPYTPEETDIIIERYLRNVRKIYGDMPAARRGFSGNVEEGVTDPSLYNDEVRLETSLSRTMVQCTRLLSEEIRVRIPGGARGSAGRILDNM